VGTHWKAKDPLHQFDAKVPSGTVLDALDASDKSLKGVAQYGDGLPITLVVSAGPLPSDLSGKTVDDATAELAGDPYKLTVTGTVDVFSQDVPKGAVVGLVTTKSDGSALPIRVGDKVQLQVSKGPEQVAVPDVVGKTWADAKKILTDAGFKLDYKKLADVAPTTFRVSKTDPKANTVVDKGSTIKVNFGSNF
ncbi:MAG: PASTA domain-containing protein, partial [Leifsonia sp.]